MPVSFKGINRGEERLPVVEAEVDVELACGGRDGCLDHAVLVRVDRSTGLASMTLYDPATKLEVFSGMAPQSLMDLGMALQELARRAGPMRASALRAERRAGGAGGEGQTVTDSRGGTRPL